MLDSANESLEAELERNEPKSVFAFVLQILESIPKSEPDLNLLAPPTGGNVAFAVVVFPVLPTLEVPKPKISLKGSLEADVAAGVELLDPAVANKGEVLFCKFKFEEEAFDIVLGTANELEEALFKKSKLRGDEGYVEAVLNLEGKVPALALVLKPPN